MTMWNTVALATVLTGLAGASFAGKSITNPNYVAYVDPSIIHRDLSDLRLVFRLNYDKYIRYQTPDGGSVPIVATDDISDEQLLRAYNILDFYLTDAPGTRFGADKTQVTNTMAENGAVLVMPGGADGDSPVRFWALAGQPLYELEFPVEGSDAYITNDFDQRDAGFEEIFHLVHDYGIGTRYTKGALSHSYQPEVATATASALSGLRWGIPTEPDVDAWIEELRDEGSLQQEYLASVIDSYYGLWGPWIEAPGGNWGVYIAKTRAEVETLDPLGAEVLRQFLPADLTYMARIDPGFSGTFEMAFNPQAPYTHKSQYLTQARLLGDGSSNLLGNAKDNVLIGNRGDNILDGGAGFDVVQYPVAADQVDLEQDGAAWIVTTETLGRDRLLNVEVVRFTDRDITLGTQP